MTTRINYQKELEELNRSLEQMGDYAFYGCGALETLCLPDTCGGGGGVGLLFMQGTFRVGVRPENRKGRG